LAILIWILALVLPAGAWGFEMRGPDPAGPVVSAVETVETSPLKLGLRGVLRIYQQGVSPVNPDRCGFRPSCSAYGALAIREHGPFWGLIMTADRLMRCHYLKKPGPFSPLLPDGKILDLPSQYSLPISAEP
jgi:putative membrane protein insertion efficiency factor